MKTFILSISIFLGSCASGFTIDYLPQQDEVISRITTLYGMSPNDVPPIAWIRDLNCDTSRGRGWKYGSLCVDGEFREESIAEGPELIKIAVWPGQTWVNSPIAHEICHVRELRQTGDGDQAHQGPCFNDPGETGQQDHGLTRRGTETLDGMGVMVQ